MPAYDSKLQLKAAGVQAASTNGTPVDLGTARPNNSTLMQFDMMVTSLSGAGATVDLVIEESPDQSTWRQVTSFRQLTLAGDAVFAGANASGKRFSRFGLVVQRYLRYRSVLASASSNFAVNCMSLDATARGMSTASF
jgi:hypothetical protein